MTSTLVSESEHEAVLGAAMNLFDHFADRDLILSRHQPRLWILNSGNAGSSYLAELLRRNGCERVEHEFRPQVGDIKLDLDSEGVRYYLGDCSFEYVASLLYLTRAPVVAECSNRLFSMAKVLKYVFPNSSFVHLVRDNRSNLGKILGREQSELLSSDYKKLRSRRLRYVTRLAGPVHASIFEQHCWYWANYNRRIRDDLGQFEAPNLLSQDLFDGDVSLFESFFNKSFQLKQIEKINESPGNIDPVPFSEWPDDCIQMWQKICGPVAKSFGIT